ncbi:MAG: helix-turn-helix domain-containing protein [Tabrizicola sp.]|nr:helix-turn-helix domain-containing protein [Tabrizicola sp.]
MAVPHLWDQLRIQQIRATLRGTVLRPTRIGDAEFNHLVVLASGSVEPDIAEARFELEAPVGFLLRPEVDFLMRLGPGTSGWLLAISPGLMAEAVGRSAESALLHAMVGRALIVHPTEERVEPDYLLALERIAAEADTPRKGAQMAVVALIRLLLIAFLREGEQDEILAPRLGGEAELLRGFRRLVEMHFRKQIAIAQYAPLLGITYDRLHSVCRRSLDRTPLQLVHQRMMREATLRLERTDQSISEIAYSLGFEEASRFSHFFSRLMGQPPSAYRAAARRDGPPSPDIAPSFADWP